MEHPRTQHQIESHNLAHPPETDRSVHAHAATRRVLAAMSVNDAMLSPSSSSPDGLNRPPEGVHRLEARQGERLGTPMPIMLATSGKGADTERVAAMLDEQGIAYSIVFVETYDRPRLQVGAAELVGETEIAAHLAKIRELSLA